jgi:LAO/AO transport system kinase
MRSLDELVDEVRQGGSRSQRAAAQLMTAVTDQPHRLAEVLAGSDTWPQPRLVLGLTGAPGSGKSTVVDHLAAEFRARRPDRRLGIVAVDPSSPFTGGAVLGDRVRMMRHATDPGVFIRSLATRGRLGGLALGVRGVVRVMALAGCDIVIVETVGVGQSEVEIARNSDIVAVLLAPGQGDSVQLLKAGLMEAGDLFVVNKADREGADHLRQQLLAMLALAQQARQDLAGMASPPVAPQVFSTSAVNHEGIAELADAIDRLTSAHGDQWQARRRRQSLDEVRQAVAEAVSRRVEAVLGRNGAAQERFEQVLRGDASIDSLVEYLLAEAAEGRRSKDAPTLSPAPDANNSHTGKEGPRT